MDEFRNKQSQRRSGGPRNSIDGFGPSRKKSPRAKAASPAAKSSSLDNFNRKEGLTPRSNTRTMPTATRKPLDFDEPLIIDKKNSSKKRGFLSRFNPRKNKPPLTKKKKIILGIATFLAILLIIFGFLVLKGYINLNRVLKGGGGAAALEANVDPSKLKGEGDGRVNILMLGRGGEGHEGADLTDTIIIASIDPIAKESALVSIPRDLYVPVKDSGSMKINAVFSTGKEAENYKNRKQKQTDQTKQQAENAGFDLLEKTIEKNLGVPIHYHAVVDFSGFKQAIDTVGGVDLNAPGAVKEQMRIDGKTYILDVKQGQQHMDGFKALAYSRSRHTSARGDFDRAERQRLVIMAFKDKVLSAGTYSNPAKISSLMGTLGGHVQTNFSVQDLSRLYQLGKEMPSNKISSIGLADPPNNYVITDNIGGQSVVVPRAGVGNYKEIQGYLRNVLKDSFIRNENASIMVLNGTQTSGLATTKGDELKSYGYNVTQVGNAPTKTYTKTTLVDLRNGSKKYTKNYLEKRFGISATTSLPDATIQPGTADFVIILGSDQANTQ